MNQQDILNQMNSMIISFEKDPHIMCFLGLGSLANQNRLDDYSDLDFFLIVEKGYKKAYLDDLSWLLVNPLQYTFLNTKDGYKAMTNLGVFMEFAIFEPDELKDIPFSPGKILYQREDFDPDIVSRSLKLKEKVDPMFRVNEALTNLYIGLLRDHRGEVASAFTFIQVYAMHHIYHLLDEVYIPITVEIDFYTIERRIEKRFPDAKDLLKHMTQGSNRNQASAKHILTFLEEHFELNSDLVDRIKSLIRNEETHEKA